MGCFGVLLGTIDAFHLGIRLVRLDRIRFNDRMLLLDRLGRLLDGSGRISGFLLLLPARRIVTANSKCQFIKNSSSLVLLISIIMIIKIKGSSLVQHQFFDRKTIRVIL